MSTEAPARSKAQRKADTLLLFEREVDAWVATADPETGTPYLIPLSFLWDGEGLLFATPTASPTIRNIGATGKARVGIGPTRDLVLIDGVAKPLDSTEVTADLGDAFARKAGFDPRQLSTPYSYLRIVPRRLQAWREANELEDRELMREGRWLVSD